MVPGCCCKSLTSFFQAYADQHEFELPDAGSTAWEWSFSRQTKIVGSPVKSIFEQIVREEGQQVLGWRTVPTDNSLLVVLARQSQPFIRQLFVGRSRDIR